MPSLLLDKYPALFLGAHHISEQLEEESGRMDAKGKK
jgi:hypothetical protein